MRAREFRPSYGFLGYAAVAMLGSTVWSLVAFPLTATTVMFPVLYMLMFVVTCVVATTCVTVSENVLEHRIAGWRRTWSLPETRVEFSELAWQRRQWRMVMRGPDKVVSVPLLGYSKKKARAIWDALYGPDGVVGQG